MSAAEEFFHVFRIATGGAIRGGAIIDFDSTNWAQGLFVTKDEVDGFVIDITVSSVGVLTADFMVEEGGDADTRNDVKTLTEDFVEKLETMFFGANHQLFFRTIVVTSDGFSTTTFRDNTGDN